MIILWSFSSCDSISVKVRTCDGGVLLVAERDDLVEGEDEMSGAADALLVGLLLRVLGEDLAEESQDVEISGCWTPCW